jgi:hypothetical protein
MVRKLLGMLFMSLLVFPLSTTMFAQEAPAPTKAATKKARWEGNVIRSSPDKSTLTVRNSDGAEMTVQYDSSTQWVSQEHGSKTVNNIDASQVKDNDRVICKGTWDKAGVLHATLISKRLSH